MDRDERNASEVMSSYPLSPSETSSSQKKRPVETGLLKWRKEENYGIVLLARFDKSLSTPAEVKDLTAKYHVPEPRPLTM